MKTIALKIAEDDFQKISIRKAKDSISAYVRQLIVDHLSGEEQDEDTKIMSVNNVENLRALAIYLTEIVKLGNPPAYSSQNEKIKNLFGQFMDRIEGEKS